MTDNLKPKYYAIIEDSMLLLVMAVNRYNTDAQKVGKETHIIQIIESLLTPGEFVAVCYDADLPPKLNTTNINRPELRETNRGYNAD